MSHIQEFNNIVERVSNHSITKNELYEAYTRGVLTYREYYVLVQLLSNKSVED